MRWLCLDNHLTIKRAPWEFYVAEQGGTIMAVTVSFINFKGGVGKTTLCVEMATALAARHHQRVLVVDIDPQTNATLWLMGQDKWEAHAQEKGTIEDFFKACLLNRHQKFDLKDVIAANPIERPEVDGRLDLLPSHIQLFGIDLKLAKKFGVDSIKARRFLRQALPQIKRRYDFILIDCPPNLYLGTQNALFASDHYLIISLAEYLSTIGINYLQDQIEAQFGLPLTAARGGAKTVRLPSPLLAGIVFNGIMTMERGSNSEERVMAQIRSRFGTKAFNTFLPQSVRLAERPWKGVPMALSTAAQDEGYVFRIERLAGELIRRVGRK
jgi:chromosome partitioning protein